MARRSKSDGDDAAATGSDAEGRYAFEGLDRLIHEKARLGILTSLSAYPDGLLFNDLKQLCALTDGNLNRHLSVLSEGGLIEVWKTASGQTRAQTLYRLTSLGHERFVDYVNELERVVRDAGAVRELPSPTARRSRFGWSGG